MTRPRVRLIVMAPPPPAGVTEGLLEQLPAPWRPGDAITLEAPGRVPGRPPPMRVEAVSLLDALPPPPEGEVTLGLCGADLYVPALTYVFGVSRLGARRGLLSWFRLKPARRRDGRECRDSLEVLQRRLLIEAIHELGHAVGLVHCVVNDCAMHRALWPESIDLKRPEYCPSCQQSLQDLLAPSLSPASSSSPGR